MKTLTIIKERVFKCGYVLRTEEIESPVRNDKPHAWTMAYTPDGHYIGNAKNARYLVAKKGICPQPQTQDSSVCSIGFSTKDSKWYGWSHRAIFGFKIGSTVKRGDCGYVEKSQGGRGEWTAKTVADAKQMACDFASGVS